MLKPRSAIQTLPEYHPPLAERDGLRLDFNENTAGCSPRVLAALRALTADDLATYPERAPGERLLAQHLGLDPAQVLLTNGTDEALHLVCETLLEPGDEVLISVPTFAMFEIYALATGAKVLRIPADAAFRFPVERVRAAITPRTRLILVANPNNPTGTAVANSDLIALAQAAPDASLLVDEAYFYFYGQTMLRELERQPNLIVSRTFSKAYGMAGLRVGVLAAGAETIAMLRRVSSPYNVNGAALACLPAALADSGYVDNYVSQVKAGRAQLEALLAELGIEYWPSHANFVLARFGAARVPLVEAMRARGILVRDRDSDPGCAGCVRITLGADEQNQRLLPVLREVVAELRSRQPAPEVKA